jgi:hypothetical protein
MKYTTPALINNTKKLRSFKTFFLGQSATQNYYKARHRTDDIFVLWIEASQFGKLQCFPCVLEEQGEPMVYEVMKGVNTKMRNAELVQRWPLFVTPQNIQEEFDVEEMSKSDFFELFGEYRRKGVQKEITKAEGKKEPEQQENTAGEPEKALAEHPEEQGSPSEDKHE